MRYLCNQSFANKTVYANTLYYSIVTQRRASLFAEPPHIAVATAMVKIAVSRSSRFHRVHQYYLRQRVFRRPVWCPVRDAPSDTKTRRVPIPKDYFAPKPRPNVVRTTDPCFRMRSFKRSSLRRKRDKKYKKYTKGYKNADPFDDRHDDDLHEYCDAKEEDIFASTTDVAAYCFVYFDALENEPEDTIIPSEDAFYPLDDDELDAEFHDAEQESTGLDENGLTEDEVEQDRAANYEREIPSKLHLSWVMYHMQYGVDLGEFVQTIDPIGQFRILKFLMSPAMLRACGEQRILDVAAVTTRVSRSYFEPLAGFPAVLQCVPEGGKSIPLIPHGFQGMGTVDCPMPTRYDALLSSAGADAPIVIDTGASTSLTPDLSDFVTPLEPVQSAEVNGLTGKTKVVGKGLVEWTIRDYWGVVQVIRTTAVFVPDASIRLFSPQAYFQDNEGKGRCVIEGRKSRLELPNGAVLEFPYNCGSNLPLMLPDQMPIQAGLLRSDAEFMVSGPFQSLLSVADMTNQNLRPSQKELLLLHQKLGHANFQWCQRLSQVPRSDTQKQVLHTKTNNVSSCDAPLCFACQIAKQSRRTPDTRSTSHPEPMILREGDLTPGSCVSMDQYISATPGRLPNTKGKEKKELKYNGGTIFVDHASSHVYLKHQVSLTAGETLRAKKAFEQYASSFGVRVKHYRADNVPFRTDSLCS